ncbi:hypothetical protein RUM44_004072 [Polyplax serrata]|uniref:Uncharacterized protein n=1 Tax=Polyplax serrata TaxID=468196 RepID=A0ABR1B1U3_POLSC
MDAGIIDPAGRSRGDWNILTRTASCPSFQGTFKGPQVLRTPQPNMSGLARLPVKWEDAHTSLDARPVISILAILRALPC